MWSYRNIGSFLLYWIVVFFLQKDLLQYWSFSFLREYFRERASVDDNSGLHREMQMEIVSEICEIKSMAKHRANSRRANGRAQHQGAIKSQANADLKLHPARRHYRIASPRITVAFLSYLSYPRQECNTGNRTPGHDGVARGHGGTPLS